VPQPVVRTILADLDTEVSQLERPNVPSLRRVRRALSRRLANSPPTTVLGVADALVRRGGFADRMIAYELVAGHAAALAALSRVRIIRWSRGLADWTTVDLFGCTLGGQAWRTGLLTDADISQWTRSPDRWQRRLALVCTVPLNIQSRGGAGDTARTLRVCEALVDDRDEMVVKALSWALRELSKRDKPAVTEFLDRHRLRVAPRVWREVTNKLTAGLKNARQTGPIP
jgi:3-methyladenine DNA glycosylase AlkD